MTSPGTAAVRRALTAAVTAVTGAALVVSSLGTGGAAASGSRADWLGGHDHSTHAHSVKPEHAADPNVWHPEHAHDHHAAGKVHAGLKESTACPGGFVVEDSTGACSHGPDPAPAGVDVRDIPTVAELRAEAAETLGGGTAAADGAVPCYGDGVSGKRVQVVYAVASDRPDRYDSVADLIRGYAWHADQAFYNSAVRDGGVRHVRWVTGSDCRLSVAHVVLSPTGDDSIANTRTELRNLGFTSNDRKYLVFADAGVYCGISYVAGDNRPDSSNPANSGATVSRVDANCWWGSISVPAHELAHAIGAVQLTAPHSNGAWHCTDEYDRLCYNDGSGATLTYLCASSQEPLLDCNGDDYFNVAPAPGSWLATHWNLANSLFLETAEPVAPPPPTTTAAPPPTTTSAPPPTTTSAPPPTTTTSAPPSPTTTTTTSAPPPTTTTTTAPPPTTTTSPSPSPSPSPTKTRGKKPRFATEFSGKLTSSKRTRTFRVAADTGTLKSVTRFRGAKRLKLVVRDSSGDLVLRKRLRSGSSVIRWVDGGKYKLTVHGRHGARFTLKVVRHL